MKVLVACEESQTVCNAFREEWKSIPGYPNYEASTMGRIRSVNRTIKYANGRIIHAKQKVLKPTISSGYQSVNLSENNVHVSKKVHTLVALTFLGEKQDGQEVRHKNGDRTDNRAENLEYGTRSENMLDGYKNYGYVCKNQKLTPQKAAEIISKRKSGKSQRELAKEYSVSKSAIAAILRGDSYSWYTAAMADQWGSLSPTGQKG